MSFSVNFPLFMIVACLASSVISAAVPKRAARIVSLALTALCAWCNLMLYLYIGGQGENVLYMMGHYPHPWGNELKLGALEAMVSLFFSFILFLCVLGGDRQMERRLRAGKGGYFYVMADLIQASLLVLAYTNDVFTGYVFIEICTLSSCGILMLRQTGQSILAAVRYMIFSLIGSSLFLFGVIILYNITGHLLMPNLRESIASFWAEGRYHMPLLASICLMSIGLGIKSGLFPFHLWMADTYGSAIPAASGILSGLVSKGYIFFLLKLIYDVFGVDVFYASGLHNALYALGACGIVVGSIGALREDSVFRMIAYSSAAQIGYIYMGIGLSPTVGMEAAIFQILTHAITKPALFLAAGQLSDAVGDAKHFIQLRGAAHREPFAGAMFAIEAFSMIGLPFTMGFISKYLFASAAFDGSHNKLVPTLLLLAVSTVLNTLYFARTVLRLYHKPEGERLERVSARGQAPYIAAAVCFAVFNLALGTLSAHFLEALNAAISLF